MPNTYDPRVLHRRSIRLRGYDYAAVGAYAITVCTLAREHLFGDVVDGQTVLNQFGAIAAEGWRWLGARHDHVVVDSFVVMPNHTHAIVILEKEGDSRIAPTTRRKPLGQLVGAFKTTTARRVNELRGTPGIPVWQRNYYEHVIRDEEDLSRIREYIVNNPANWADDEENLNTSGQSRGRHGHVTDTFGRFHDER